MFGNQDALGKCLCCVIGMDRHLGPAEDFARIELFCHDMDRAAPEGVACVDCPRMRVEPAIFGQQGRVDVDDAPAPR